MSEEQPNNSVKDEMAELRRLDGEIVDLRKRAFEARRVLDETTARLYRAQARRAVLELGVREETGATRRRGPAWPGPTRAASGAPAPRPVSSPKVTSSAETSQRVVQVVLFALGGLLLGSAAVVFITVAWAHVGLAGRSMILSALTLAFLAVPAVAGRRGLFGAAETFAALGLLLVLLDGYAAWHVNLARVTERMSGTTYLAVALLAVAGTSALCWRAYPRLLSPVIAALLAVQPVPALLGQGRGLGVAGWSAVLVATAVTDVGFRWVSGRMSGVRASGLRHLSDILAGMWLLMAVGLALAGLATARPPAEGIRVAGALALASPAVVLAGRVGRRYPVPDIAVCAGIALLSLAAIRAVESGWQGMGMIAMAGICSGFALGVTRPRVRSRPGVLAGGWVVVGASCVPLIVWIGAGALVVAGSGLPAWSSPALYPSQMYPAQLPVALVCCATSLTVLWRLAGPRTEYLVACAGPVLLGTLALALPLVLPAARWIPVLLDGLAGAVCAVWAVLATRLRPAGLAAAVAGWLLAHAAMVGLSSPLSTSAVALIALLIAITVVTLARTVAGWGGASRPVALAAAVIVPLAVPGFCAGLARTTLGAGKLSLGWIGSPFPGQAGALVGLVCATAVALAVRKVVRPALPSAVVGVAFSGFVLTIAVLPAQPLAVVAATGLVCSALATGVVLKPQIRAALAGGARWSGALSGVKTISAVQATIVGIAVLPSALAAALGPCTWFDAVWRGRPEGSGVVATQWEPFAAGGPFAVTTASVTCAVVVLLCVIATRVLAAVPTWRVVAWLASFPGGLWLALAVIAADVRWPAYPALLLALGVVWSTMAAWGPVTGPAWPVELLGSVLTVSGLAACLATRAATLCGLGLVVVTSVLRGARGTTGGQRVRGWLGFSLSLGLLALASARAAGMTLWWSSYAVLLAAALILTVSVALLLRGRGEGRVLEWAAHACALVAVTMTIGSAAHAAGLFILWALVLGARALVPRRCPSGRLARVACGVGCALLGYWWGLVAGQIATVEVFTVPLAVAVAVWGWFARRRRPELTSWSAYGIALLVAVAPSAVLVATGLGGDPVRRLLLGIAGLALVLRGAATRQRAPVIVGAAVTGFVAVHETVLLLDLIPRWIPLALGGILLVGVATTYERRRRDLARLRETIRSLG